jgi:hypothetical protein
MLRFAQHDEGTLTKKGLAQCAGRFSRSLGLSLLHAPAHPNGVTLSEAKGLGVAGGRCFASLSMTKGLDVTRGRGDTTATSGRSL